MEIVVWPNRPYELPIKVCFINKKSKKSQIMIKEHKKNLNGKHYELRRVKNSILKRVF